MPLADTENDATSTLLLLRREAGMSQPQIAHLYRLAADLHALNAQMRVLEEAFAEFRNNMTLSGCVLSLAFPGLDDAWRVPRNPVAWSDELRAKVEGLVGKWIAQKEMMERIQGLFDASNVALGVPDDGFDDLDSEF